MFVCSFVCVFVCLCVCLFVCLLGCSFVCLFVCLFVPLIIDNLFNEDTLHRGAHGTERPYDSGCPITVVKRLRSQKAATVSSSSFSSHPALNERSHFLFACLIPYYYLYLCFSLFSSVIFGLLLKKVRKGCRVLLKLKLQF